MTCREFVESTTDYLEGELTPARAREFEAHLASCSNCRAHFEQAKQLIQGVGMLRNHSSPREVPERLREALSRRAADQGPSTAGEPVAIPSEPYRTPASRHARLILAVSALAIVFAAAAPWLWRRVHPRSQSERAAVLDLREWAALRGNQSPAATASRAKLELPHTRLRVTVYLPSGSSPGDYQLQVLDASGKAAAASRDAAKPEGNDMTLHLNLDLSRLTPGHYSLALRRETLEWNYYPLEIR